MTIKLKKKAKNWNFLSFINFFKDIFYKIIIFSVSQLLEISLDLLLKCYAIYNKVNKKLLIKQILLSFIYLYYLYNIFFPKGILISVVRSSYEHYSLKKEIQILRNQQYYTEKIILAIKNNNSDMIEELIINNAGKQFNTNRLFLYLSD